MALQKTITLPSGMEATDAYHRVESLSVERKEQLTFVVRSYFDKTKPFVTEEGVACRYDIDGDNPFKQAYLHLKTLPGYENAIDC